MFAVALNKEFDQTHWLDLTRFVETFAGPPGEDWDFDENDGEMVYMFRYQRQAEIFDRVWNRNPLILAYDMWKEFCLTPLGRERLDSHWLWEGWTPTAVLEAEPLDKELVVQGGRREYRPSLKLWFFEHQSDALVFWIERNG